MKLVPCGAGFSWPCEPEVLTMDVIIWPKNKLTLLPFEVRAYLHQQTS